MTNDLAADIVHGRHRNFPAGYDVGLAQAVVCGTTTIAQGNAELDALGAHPDPTVRASAKKARRKIASLYARRERQIRREQDPIAAVEEDLDRLYERFMAGEDVSNEPGFNPDWCD